VFVNYDAVKGSAGGTYAVRVGQKTLTGVVQAGSNHEVNLGRISLPAGPVPLAVAGQVVKGDELFRLRHLMLKTAGP